MRPRYASDSYDADKARRLRRIRRRACPELKDAYEAGTISLRQFDLDRYANDDGDFVLVCFRQF